MATQGYCLCEFISISRILRRAPSRYYRAFLYAETDDSDVAYFVLNQLKVIIQAIDELHEYLARKAQEDSETTLLLRSSRIVKEALNHRQLALVQHALKHPSYVYTFDSHRVSHNITYETSRTDLLGLRNSSYLKSVKLASDSSLYHQQTYANALRSLRPKLRKAQKFRKPRNQGSYSPNLRS